MIIDTLHTTTFRNLAATRLKPHDRFNIVYGNNGQGKTNLLEAIYLLSASRSFRPQTNADLVTFGHSKALIEAKILRKTHESLVRIECAPNRKQIFLNNSAVPNQSLYFGTVNVVTFGPEDIMLIKGSPSNRRNFIDRIIENAKPAYAHELDAYTQTLNQRNALLKEESINQGVLDIYTEQLVHYGADLLLRRLDFLLHFKPVLESVFRAIFDPTYVAELAYMLGEGAQSTPLDELLEGVDCSTSATQTLQVSRASDPVRSVIEKWLTDALERTAPQERRRGFTVVGPHRDDLRATINGYEVKTFASQGQHRGFVLALKIAEIQYLEERYHFAPILLLDDVSSELDKERNRFLFNYLGNRQEGQVFITTTDPNYILLDRSMTKLYHMENGHCKEVSDTLVHII